MDIFTSVGILQVLAVTGQVSYSVAIPIIMGQNIGTCITAMLSSIGATKNAKRAAMVHLCFNIIGNVVCMVIFAGVRTAIAPAILAQGATTFGIAVAHSASPNFPCRTKLNAIAVNAIYAIRM